jgi:DNA-directed RNA polymerase specialized sigma24 family protein
MGRSNLQGPSAYDSDSNLNELLKQHDKYITTLAQTRVPRNIVRPEMLADEIEELAQRVRIKLWLTLQKRCIRNIKAYIRCIVYTEVIDMVRRNRSTISLPLDEDGELYQGNVIYPPGQGMQDPGFEIEQAEELGNSIQGISEAIVQLPPRQQYAMICSLNEQIDDALPIIDTLKNQLTNVDAVNWPEEKNELQSLRTSLSIARKKLQSLKRKP